MIFYLPYPETTALWTYIQLIKDHENRTSAIIGHFNTILETEECLMRKQLKKLESKSMVEAYLSDNLSL